MKKTLLFCLIMSFNVSVLAQQKMLLVTLKNNDKHYITENSFTKKIENDKEFIGFTIGVNNNDDEDNEYSKYHVFKMNSKNCSNNKNGELLKVDDKNNVIQTFNINFNDKNQSYSPSTYAFALCEVYDFFEEHQELYNSTLQSIKEKIIQEKNTSWKELYSDKEISYLPTYLKFETNYVTVPLRLQKEDVKYYKASINKEFCRDESGIIQLHTTSGIQLKNASFDLNNNEKNSAEFTQELAKEMCKYVMLNHKFKKAIVINSDGTITRKEASK